MANDGAPPTEPGDAIVDLYGKALEGFDRSIVALTGGAIVLSVTFVHDVAPKPITSSLFWLWLGWGSLLFSLTCIIGSMLTGHKAIEETMETGQIKSFTAATTALNIASAIGLIVGLFGLAYFAQANLFANACNK